MVDLPLKKALVAVLSPIQCNYECFKDDTYICPQQVDCCKGCYFDHGKGEKYAAEVCDKENRCDNHKVIYKVVDYRQE